MAPVIGVLALIFFIGLVAIIPASVDQVAFYLTLLCYSLESV